MFHVKHFRKGVRGDFISPFSMEKEFLSCLKIDETNKDFNKFRRASTLKKYQMLYLNVMLSMFKYDNLPDGLTPREIERNLNEFGVACVVKNGDKLYVGCPTLSAPLDQYGYGITIWTTTGNGDTLTAVEGETGALMWNNSTRTPNYDVMDTSLIMTDIDTSINALVFNARAHKLPVAKNSKVKEVIDTALSNTINGGRSYTIVNDASFIDEVNGKDLAIQTLELTDPRLMDSVQYLSKLHDDILRRKATMYGHALNTTGKLAQQSKDEINDYDSISMIIPEDMLECRIKGVEKINEVFGCNITVDYSLPWRYKMYKQNDGDDGVTPPEEIEQGVE